MELNAYDFDKTIYDGDSTVDFYKFCLKKSKLVLFSLPSAGLSLVLYILGFYSKTQFKETFYGFLQYVKNIDECILQFWSIHDKKIKPWYLKKSKSSDVVISASPEFLLSPICKELGVTLIASIVDKKTGKYTGENCCGEQKAIKFREQMGNCIIKEFYSDSISDKPLSDLAQKSYLVKGNTCVEWNQYKPSVLQRVKALFVTKEFLIFIFCGGMGTLSNFVFSLMISIKLDPTISYVFGYVLSLFVAYLCNSYLIFKEQLSVEKYLKFVISYIPNFLILFVFVYVFLNILGWGKIIVYALAGLLGLPITYMFVKIYTFSNDY